MSFEVSFLMLFRALDSFLTTDKRHAEDQGARTLRGFTKGESPSICCLGIDWHIVLNVHDTGAALHLTAGAVQSL